jgi:hypothetical protein
MAKRKSIEIPGVHHQNPIPMGAKIGTIVYSSAICGLEPNVKSAATVIKKFLTFCEQFDLS